MLEDVSFHIQKGDFVGIMGPNGSGKSTILKLVCQILKPNGGHVLVSEKVAPLLELAAGFHSELTGHENIFLYGSILGMTDIEIKRKWSSIVAFADLGEFLYTRTKFYSDGMLVRLGFAIVIHSEFDILVADEVLAVCDASFQQKCLSRINEIQRENKTILFVSHDAELVYRICNKIIHVLDKKVIVTDNSKIQELWIKNTEELPLAF